MFSSNTWKNPATVAKSVAYLLPFDFVKEARDLLGSLDTSARNRFRRDPEILAEWSTAARHHRTGGSGADETPAPVAAPA